MYMITVDETHIECTKESQEFEIHKAGRTPKLIVGYRIETKYDYDRHKISDRHKPTRIRFLSKDFDDVYEWYYLLGIELPVPEKLKQLHHTIVTTDNITVSDYYDYLDIHDYTCEDNFLLLRKNLYIIDNRHLDEIIPKYKTPEALKRMLKDPNIMFYQNCDEFKIFLII